MSMKRSNSIDDFRSVEEYWKHKYYDSEKQIERLTSLNNDLIMEIKVMKMTMHEISLQAKEGDVLINRLMRQLLNEDYDDENLIRDIYNHFHFDEEI